jgi:hypothetical protein
MIPLPLSWIIGGATSAALAVALWFSHAEVKDLREKNANQVTEIALAEANTATCRTAITAQNAQWKAKSDADEARVAAISAAYESNRKATDEANRAVGAFLAHRPTGNTLLERYESVDAQVMGDLK